MFTGIVQGVACVQSITDRPGLRSIRVALPNRATEALEVGASVSIDGVCLTVTEKPDAASAAFDVMQQTLALTTLGALMQDGRINLERAARVGAEIGGHSLSGHVDFTATIVNVRRPENNCVLRIGVAAPWMRYLFARGYVAINGASLTIAQVNRERSGAGWFEVWLIPETLRVTTFPDKKENDLVNVELDRQTQIFVDTVRDAIHDQLGPMQLALDALLRERAVELEGPTHSMKRSDAASIRHGPYQHPAGALLSTGGLGTMATKKKAAKKKGKARKVSPRDGGQNQGPFAMTPHDGGQNQGPFTKSPRKKK
jgi:riboflavin synthase